MKLVTLFSGSDAMCRERRVRNRDNGCSDHLVKLKQD